MPFTALARIRRLFAAGAVAIGGHVTAATAFAQQPVHSSATPISIEVTVRDTAARPIPGAQLSIVHGLNDVLVAVVADDRGRGHLSASVDAGEYQIVVRRIGYEPASRFFRAPLDTLAFDIVLHPAVRELAPVTVSAQRDVKRASYHIGADEIASSTRPLFNAADVVAKLRPDMICGRSCSPLGSVAAAHRNPILKCPGRAFLDPVPMACPADTSPPALETNVWVNGQRIRTVALDEVALAHQTGLLSGLKPGSMTVLSQIKPEHIAEITYLDEFDTTIDKAGAQAAIFVVLKPGIAYQPGAASYVVEPTAKDRAQRVPRAPTVLPAYRYRVLGVFDATTGDPIEGATVTNVQNGEYVRTTNTGTVSLVFLPDGGSPVRITKDGYESLSLVVELSPETTTPLTLTMTRKLER